MKLDMERSGAYSIIWWKPIEKAEPEEASYVLIKVPGDEAGFVSEMVAYENGEFWDLAPRIDRPIDRGQILGWAYLPGDDREQESGVSFL